MEKTLEERKYFKKLIGDRIYFSPISLEDTEEYLDMVNEIKVSVGLGCIVYTGIVDFESEKEVLSSLKKGKNFAVRLLENNELLGNIGFNSIGEIHRTAEIGIMLGNPKYQRKGYGMEALNLLLDYGFSFLNLRNIYLKVFEYNEPAYNLYKKAGFKEVGRLRKAVYEGDVDQGSVMAGYTAAQFDRLYSVPELLEKLMSEYQLAKNSVK